MNVEIRQESDGIRWQGQTVGNDGGGAMFGKDAAGCLWLRIICVRDGQSWANDVGLGDGKAIADYLSERFKGDAW